MPRSVNTAGLQNAFANLGQSNARIANLEFQEREKRRAERGQLGGIAGGIIGGSFGGPAGAAAGGAIGSKLAGGDVSQGATGANIGGAIAQQRSQSEQQEQQRQSLATLQQVRQDAAQNRQIETGETVGDDFFSSFKPASRSPEQIAQAESQPFVPIQGQQQAPLIFPVRQPQTQGGLLGLDTQAIDIQPVQERGSAVQREPTQQQVAQSQAEQQRADRLSTRDTAPFAVPREQLPQRANDFDRITNKAKNRLSIEEAALQDPRLASSPQAFAIQQQRVQEFQKQLNDFELQQAKFRGQSRAKGKKEVRVTDDFANFLTRRTQSKGTLAEMDKFGSDLKSLRKKGLVTDANFIEESEDLRKERRTIQDNSLKSIERESDKAFKLRDDFKKESKDLDRAQNSYKKIQGLVKSDKPSGQKDIAIMTTFLKVVDPPSVARESEVASVKNAVSFMDKLSQMTTKEASGELLKPEVRNQFLDAARVINNVSLAEERKIINDISTIGQNNNVSRSKIFGNREILDTFDTSGFSTKARINLKELVSLIGSDDGQGGKVSLRDVEQFYDQINGSTN